MPYRVLTEFAGLFRGQPYRHRDSSRGDFVAIHLYEDLVALGRSDKLVARVNAGERVLNTRNKRRGVTSRCLNPVETERVYAALERISREYEWRF